MKRQFGGIKRNTTTHRAQIAPESTSRYTVENENYMSSISSSRGMGTSQASGDFMSEIDGFFETIVAAPAGALDSKPKEASKLAQGF